MSIGLLADRRITVYRRTAFLLDSVTAAVSHVADRQPAAPALVRVRLTGGQAATGTVTVHGTVGGVPATDALVFAGPDALETVQVFSALASPALTTTGLADEVPPPAIQADAVGRDGSTVNSPYVLVSAWPMRKDAGRARWPAPPPGSTQIEEAMFYMDYTSVWTPQSGDVFVDDRTGETWLVQGNPAQHGGGMTTPHHYEIPVKRREGSAAF